MTEWPKEYAEIIERLESVRLPPRIKVTRTDRGELRRPMNTGAEGLQGSVVVTSQQTRHDIEELMRYREPYSYWPKDAASPIFLYPANCHVARETLQLGTDRYEAEIELTFMVKR